MALNGFALGGAAQGIDAARSLNIQQQSTDQNYQLGLGRLKLEQQAQQNEQSRFQQTRIDKVLSDAKTDLFTGITQAKAGGATNAQILKTFGPWIDQLKQTYKKAGMDPTTAVDVPLNSTISGTPSFNVAALVQGGADQYGVPQDIAHNLVMHESGGRNVGPNSKGSAGVMQLQPGTAKDLGVNPMNPETAIPKGLSYLRQQYDAFGNWGLASAAYNWGPGNLQKWLKNGADPAKVPKETANYVESVTGKPIQEWLPGGQGAQQPAPQQDPMAEVNHWTGVLAGLGRYSTPGMQDAVKLRLQDAIQRAHPDASVHFLKTEDGNEVPLVIKKEGGNVQITDVNGNPYVSPQGTGKSDAEAISHAIVTGLQPPVLTGLYKNSKAVRAALARDGFDLTNATLEWKAAEKQIQSLNGPQMVRYAGLANSVVNTIDEVRKLSEQMKNSGIPALNAAKLQTLIQTAGNSPAGQLATKYQAAVNTLKEEFANLANGGYAPTEPAWALANQQINGNYGVDQLAAGLTEVQRLIRYRLNAIPNFKTLGAGGTNRYIGGGQPADTGGHAAAPSAAPAVPPPPPGFVVVSPGK